MATTLTLRVNGEPHTPSVDDPDTPLPFAPRNALGPHGPRSGCGPPDKVLAALDRP